MIPVLIHLCRQQLESVDNNDTDSSHSTVQNFVPEVSAINDRRYDVPSFSVDMIM